MSGQVGRFAGQQADGVSAVTRPRQAQGLRAVARDCARGGIRVPGLRWRPAFRRRRLAWITSSGANKTLRLALHVTSDVQGKLGVTLESVDQGEAVFQGSEVLFDGENFSFESIR